MKGGDGWRLQSCENNFSLAIVGYWEKFFIEEFGL